MAATVVVPVSKTKELKGVGPATFDTRSMPQLTHPMLLQTEKRDTLITWEKQVQSQWEAGTRTSCAPPECGIG